MFNLIMRRFDWWRFEPHPEWIDPVQNAQGLLVAAAAGIPGQVRVYYLTEIRKHTLKGLEPGRAYQATLVDPIRGDEYPASAPVTADSEGRATAPQGQVSQDWVLILRPAGPTG